MEKEEMRMDSKQLLRRRMSALRKNVTDEQALRAEKKCVEALKKSPLYDRYSCFYPYVSYQKELPTHFLIEELIRDGKRVAVPKVEGQEMKFYEIRSLNDCEPGCMNILEPVHQKKELTEEGLVIVPGLAFDEKGGRMGYGGGFYDKYFNRYPYQHSLGWFYDFQCVDEVPMEEHDCRICDLISPEKGCRHPAWLPEIEKKS